MTALLVVEDLRVDSVLERGETLRLVGDGIHDVTAPEHPN